MAKQDSIQKKLSKVRAPRVHLTYDVEIGDAIETKEIPFVVGVMGEFSGDSTLEQPKLKDKKFVEIDLDTFDEVMSGLAPRATFKVDNKVSDKRGEFAVDLAFNSIDDFRPESIANQVEPLRQLVEARDRLADIRNKISANEKLEDLLEDVLNNTEQVKQMAKTSAANQE
ncbi:MULTISPECIES: type VI secretion system contractile sheath small subunit [unclassified Psychrobacter]|uniref:type VI secretion system contractile sheath small subunit n=1 Tax=unclassified Psychrobacter TaxID=196806 RepID=UPI0018F44E17|nr:MULTISPECIES: type VI secretion system contractile sheath small subunit [unclassified Psychrobacter]